MRPPTATIKDVARLSGVSVMTVSRVINGGVRVSPDTRRDYLLSSDAATLALQQLDSAQPGFSTALIREGRSRTIAEVLGLIGAVARRRVPAVYAERPESRLQPRSLRFSAPVALPGNTRLTPMETGIARMVMAPLAV